MAINIGADISTIYIDDKAVDKVYVGDKLVYQRQSGEHYLTFSSENPFSIDPQGAKWNGSMQYSTDAQTWIDWDGSTVSAARGEDGYYLYLRGTGNTVVTGYSSDGNDTRWILTGTDISCIGNIETLLDYAKVSKGIHPIMGESCFHYLFYNNSALINAPELPSPVLTKLCYAYTFSKTGITTSPELPATTLAEHCYSSMFFGCTSLTSCPSLPATNLAERCYSAMFNGCTSLTSCPSLPATNLAEYCYNSMFYDCTSLTSCPSLPATNLAKYCCGAMFFGCTSLTSCPSLPATNLAERCYSAMFNGCTKIKLSTTRTGEYVNQYRIPTSGTGIMAKDSLGSMFSNTGGTFTGTPAINTTYYTSNEIV